MTKIDAEVTIKFVIDDICDSEDLDPDFGDEFNLFVQDRIRDEGLHSLLEPGMEDNYEIVSIKKIH